MVRIDVYKRQLLNEDGTPVLDANGDPMTATTDENGAYQFVGLAPASYRVVIVDPNSGDLAGLLPTQAYTGRGATQASVTISDASVQGVDFGLVAPASIGDRVWNDVNANGADDGEPGIGGVTVILTDADGMEVARTTTDANGNYRFTGLDVYKRQGMEGARGAGGHGRIRGDAQSRTSATRPNWCGGRRRARRARLWRQWITGPGRGACGRQQENPDKFRT